jgi:hypothetical protein
MTEALWFDQFTLEISINFDASNFFPTDGEQKSKSTTFSFTVSSNK